MLKKNPKNQTGITLIELLVVITILGILATVIVGSGLFKNIGRAKEGVARVNIAELKGALGRYAAHVGRYPSDEEGLQALFFEPENVEGWDGKYIEDPNFNDPWGEPYVYRSPTDRPNYEYEIISKGADGEEGTEDDITSFYAEAEEGAEAMAEGF